MTPETVARVVRGLIAGTLIALGPEVYFFLYTEPAVPWAWKQWFVYVALAIGAGFIAYVSSRAPANQPVKAPAGAGDGGDVHSGHSTPPSNGDKPPDQNDRAFAFFALMLGVAGVAVAMSLPLLLANQVPLKVVIGLAGLLTGTLYCFCVWSWHPKEYPDARRRFEHWLSVAGSFATVFLLTTS